MNAPSSTAERKYVSPTIVVVGSVKDLTRGPKTSGKNDVSPIPLNVS